MNVEKVITQHKHRTELHWQIVKWYIWVLLKNQIAFLFFFPLSLFALLSFSYRIGRHKKRKLMKILWHILCVYSSMTNWIVLCNCHYHFYRSLKNNPKPILAVNRKSVDIFNYLSSDYFQIIKNWWKSNQKSLLQM